MDSASRIKSKFISRNNVKRKFQTFNDAENSITDQWYLVVTAEFTGNFTISWSGLKKTTEALMLFKVRSIVCFNHDQIY
jgi:hypothetical protein